LAKELSSCGSVALHQYLLLNDVAWRWDPALAAMAVEALIAGTQAAIAAHKANAFVDGRLAFANLPLGVNVPPAFLLAELRCCFAEGDVGCCGSIRPDSSRRHPTKHN
jgi:hypothetical protein